MREKLARLPAEVLQHLSLLIALLLLVAAKDFIANAPALSSGVIFLFTLPFLAAAILARKAHFLYAAMLLGAVSYFVLCYALGAPAALFPALSVPLVAALWLVGRQLETRLPAHHGAYPLTVFRAMNITVAVFSVWALVQTPLLDLGTQLGSRIAGLAFLGYAVIYLGHSLKGAPIGYVYLFSGFLTGAGGMLGTALLSFQASWEPTLLAAVAILQVGTENHPRRGYRWSRHAYLCACMATVVALLLSLSHWTSLVLCLSLAALVLWTGYMWLTVAVPTVARATTAERAAAKCFFLGALGLSLPVVPAVFIAPATPSITLAALVMACMYWWIVWWRRHEEGAGRAVYTLMASTFLAAAFTGVGIQFGGGGATGWLLLIPVLLLTGLAYARNVLAAAPGSAFENDLARAAMAPAFFGWYVALLYLEPSLALVTIGPVIIGLLVMAKAFKNRWVLAALGPVCAGAFVIVTQLFVGRDVGWAVCTVGAVVAGACYMWADSRDRRTVVRTAIGTAWLIISVASSVLGARAGAIPALYSATAIAFAAILMAGCRNGAKKPDALDRLVGIVAVAGTLATLCLGPLRGMPSVMSGACILTLALAYLAGWTIGGRAWYARAGNALLALGLLLVIFGGLSEPVARLTAGAATVFMFFCLTTASRKNPLFAESALVAGHASSIVMAVAALVLTWTGTSALVPWVVVAYAAIHVAFPRRNETDFRVGALLWASIAILLALAVSRNTVYREQLMPFAVLSLLWVGAGYAARRRQALSWETALFVCATMVALVAGGLSVVSPAASGSWGVFLVVGAAFAALLLLLHRSIFAYLLTLSLSLMAYDWIRLSTSHFTQDLLFYLVAGIGVLGVFFALPYLRRGVDRLNLLPLFSIFTRQGAALAAIPVLAIAALAVAAYSLEITAYPKFCMICHNMDTFYNSWQHSSHKDVACVECHYDPGVEAVVKGKLAAMVQLTKFLTHSVSGMPHARINNAACMRPACHAGMDHDKETLVFRGKIRFRHEKHLSARPRGKELNCVSCHGQTVEGQHIGVTETTCITCHFYGRGKKPTAIGDCLLCHILPDKAVVHNGQEFNHKDFIDDNTDVRCWDCHSNVTEGDGHVSPTRCRNCHFQRREKITDQRKFHLIHVSKGHFDCLECHDEIKHGTQSMEEQSLTTRNCANCHGSEQHSLQARIYAGTVLPELETSPDVMYEAGVSCDGCHAGDTVLTVGHTERRTRTASAAECTACHGDEAYGEMLGEWQGETKARVAKLQTALEAVRGRAAKVAATGNDAAAIKRMLADAGTMISYVVTDGSYGAHNNMLITTILDRAEERLKACQTILDGTSRK
ncbi:MAG: hypothetical protein GXP31_13620 [Kiritimatiellaeota bacterium]|nr:hypothetical protein [Kiritimatiellota bacterium]